MTPGRRLAELYRGGAVLLLNTLLLFAAVNLLLAIFFPPSGGTSAPVNPVLEKYGDTVRQAYPGWKDEEIATLLRETWTRPYAYEAYAETKEAAFRGRYVNVDEHGFRLSRNQGPWPPDRARYFTVFLFGGSTGFSYGLPDDQTVASYLQDALATSGPRGVRVYNFGRGHYFSSQERVLFEKLLVAGFVPDAAIFLDGLNDFEHARDEPHFTARMAQYFERDPCAAEGSRLAAVLNLMPLTRAAVALKQRISGAEPQAAAEPRLRPARPASESAPAGSRAEGARAALARYFENKRLIEAAAAAYGVQAVFVWQPVPVYGYDWGKHAFTKGASQSQFLAHIGYPLMAAQREEKSPGKNFVWCADLHGESAEPLYVDVTHYSAKMAERVAGCIATQMAERGLIPPRTPK